MWRETLFFLCLCLGWYLASSFTNNFGKQILNEFDFPVTLTWIQFGLVACFCFLGPGLNFKHNLILVPSPYALSQMSILAIFQLVSHILSSIAISRIPVSLVHTIKALSPLITVLSYKVGFNISYSYKVYISLIPLISGVMLVCLNELEFEFFGFLCAFCATFVFVSQNIFSKKVFNHNKMLLESEKLDKMNVLFISSYLAFGLMSPLWFYMEGIKLAKAPWPSFGILFLILLNGITNFLQSLIAFWVLELVSPITYSIASLFKRIFVIILAILYFGKEIRFFQGFGIALTFVGLWMYNDAKREVAKGEAKIAAIQEKRDHDTLPLTTKTSSEDL